MITKEELNRSYALMECERSGGCKPNIDFYLKQQLITPIEAKQFYNSFPTETGPNKTVYFHLNFGYRCENPLPPGKKYSPGGYMGIPDVIDYQEGQ